MKLNKEKRYVIRNDNIALKLGLTINKTKRYRLTDFQEAKYHNFDIQNVKRLFFDIETSQYIVRSWRIGYKINLQYEDVVELPKIICISWKWENEDKIHNLSWDDDMCDKQMIEEFISVLNKADEIVGHNSDRFDIKWIRTRAMYHRLPMNAHYRSLDTLKKAKAHFNLPNNRLDTIAQFLKVGAKVKHEGLPMWQKVQDNDRDALKDMIKYCNGDILILEDCFFVMQNYIKHNTHVGVNAGGEKYTCPNCGSEDVILYKNNFTAIGTIKRQMECNLCSYSYETSNAAYRKFLEIKSINTL